MSALRSRAVSAAERLVDEIERLGPATVRDEDDALHDLRVAMRKLRTVLRAARPSLDRAAVDDLRQRIRSAAEVLGEARDAEVLVAALRDVAGEAPEVDLGHLLERSRNRWLSAELRAAGFLNSARYVALIRDLRDFVGDPPERDSGRGPGDVVRRDLRRLRGRLAAAEAPGLAGPERERRLHEVRKGAKRLRYDADLLADGEAATAAAAERIQDALGERRDLFALIDALEGEVRRRREAGDPDPRIGALVAEQVRRTDDAAAAFRAAIADLPD